jgi:hypothetical protein
MLLKETGIAVLETTRSTGPEVEYRFSLKPLLMNATESSTMCDIQSQSYFTTDGRSVSQYVLVSSPLWVL